MVHAGCNIPAIVIVTRRFMTVEAAAFLNDLKRRKISFNAK